MLLDINPATIRNGVEKNDPVSGAGQAELGVDRDAEMKALRRENSEVRRANEIPKTDSAFSQRRRSTADYIDERRHRIGVNPICIVHRLYKLYRRRDRSGEYLRRQHATQSTTTSDGNATGSRRRARRVADNRLPRTSGIAPRTSLPHIASH